MVVFGQYYSPWRKISIFSKITNKIRASTLFTFIQNTAWKFNESNKSRERNKMNSKSKEEAKLLIFYNDMILS